MSISVIACRYEGHIYALVLPSYIVMNIHLCIDDIESLTKSAARGNQMVEGGLVNSWMNQQKFLNETNETNEKPND